jgi:hypothetical protein
VQQHNLRHILGTYWSPAKEQLWKFPASRALEKLVDYVLAQVELHRLHKPRFEVFGAKVAIRGPVKDNAALRQSHGGHGVWSGEMVLVEAVPALVRTRGTSRELVIHGESTEARSKHKQQANVLEG